MELRSLHKLGVGFMEFRKALQVRGGRNHVKGTGLSVGWNG
jgi:hypothetical protein